MTVPWMSLAWCVSALLIAASCGNSTGQRVADPAAESRDGIVVRNLDRAGAFEVRNSGPDTELALEVTVQQQQNAEWSDAVTDLTLIEKCGETPAGNHVLLRHGATLRPAPWNGLSCGSQCPASCRANVYLGPGRFRFVVSTSGGRRRFYGPSFDLPAYEQRK